MKTEVTDECSKGALVIGMFLVLLVGGVLRFGQLESRSVWFDEAFCWRLIQFPFPEMIRRTALDNHPPLYFVLLKIWAMLFGDSTFALRSLSALFGMATCVGAYLMVRSARMLCSHGCGRRVGMLAAAMIACSTFQIRWSWDVRMYALGSALAVFSSAALFRALGKAGCWNWFLYGGLALSFAYTHYYALFSIVGQFVFIIGYLLYQCSELSPAINRRRQFCCFMTCALLLVVGYLPWLPAFIGQRAQVQNEYWTTDVHVQDVLGVTYGMLLMPENGIPSDVEKYISAIVSVAILFALCWRPTLLQCYLLLGTLVPFLASIAVSLLDTKVFHLRYFVFAHIFLFAGFGVVVSRLYDPLVRWGSAAITVSWLLLIHLAFVDELRMPYRPGAQGANRFLAYARKPRERVLVCSPLLYFSMLHHAHDRKGWYVVNEGRSIPHYEGSAALIREEVVSANDLTAMDDSSIWVIDMTGWGGRRVSVPSNWKLQSEEYFREVFRIQGEIIVRRYDIKPSQAPAR